MKMTMAVVLVFELILRQIALKMDHHCWPSATRVVTSSLSDASSNMKHMRRLGHNTPLIGAFQAHHTLPR